MNAEASHWLCTVCGYLHDGAEPPECCPVCGATHDLFEPQVEKVTVAQPPATGLWRCLNCDHLHSGDAPPDCCPVCGAEPEQFEACEEATVQEVESVTERHVVIVGAGIAGVSAAEAARQASSTARITLLSKEAELPYYRLNLTRYLAGEIEVDQLPMHPPGWYDERGIDLRLGTELRHIDASQRSLELTDGSALDYDRLILATGSHPFVPPIAGSNRENVTVLRTIRDAERILASLRKGLQCVMIGGGVLGLETAGALLRHGVDVTLLEGYGWLLPQQLNRIAGEKLATYAENLGIRVRQDVRVKQIVGDERARGVALEEGEIVPADLVVVTAGVRSNSYLARLAKLDVNQGVLADDSLRTSQPEIFAAGDVAEHRGVCYGTWAPSQFQGVIAGMNAVGGEVEFGGIPRSNLLKVLGYDMMSIGQVHPDDGSYLTFEWGDGDDYCHLVFRDDHLVGAILLGGMHYSAVVKQLIETGQNCADLLHGSPDAAAVAAFLDTHSG